MAMPGAALLGGYAGVILDAEGDVLNSRVNFDSGELLVDDIPVGPGGSLDLSDVARLSLPNVFQRETTFSGQRLGIIRLVSSDYTVQPTDGVILVDCSSDDVPIFLPPATGNGQLLRIRKIDTTDNVVIIQPVLGDLIDIYSSLTLGAGSGKSTLIIDVLTHLWDLHISPWTAVTNQENTFTQPTSLAGLRLSPPKLITTTGYLIQPTDGEILVDTSVNNIDIALILPLSEGSGHLLHIKKISAGHLVSINTQGDDLIDGVEGLNLTGLGSDALLIAGAPNYWDNTGPSFDDAMFLPFFSTKLRILADGTLQIFNPDQSKYHTLTVRGAAGAEYLTIAAGVP
jgi:hypothetical protein